MKLTPAFLLLSFCVFGATAQKSPRFSKITDAYYLSKFEVSNTDYKMYLNYLRQTKNDALYIKSLPDTTVWGNNNLLSGLFIFLIQAIQTIH